MIRWAFAFALFGSMASAELVHDEPLIRDIIVEACLPYLEDGTSPFGEGSPLYDPAPQLVTQDEAREHNVHPELAATAVAVLEKRGLLSYGMIGEFRSCAFTRSLGPPATPLRIEPDGFIERLSESLERDGFLLMDPEASFDIEPWMSVRWHRSEAEVVRVTISTSALPGMLDTPVVAHVGLIRFP